MTDSAALLLLLLSCAMVGGTGPPTLPHVHYAAPHPAHLDLNTIKGVMETIEKMWHDYTQLTNRSAEIESKLASTEERLTAASRLCEIEKKALDQVHWVRVVGLERRLAVARAGAQNASSCSCELARCQHYRDNHKNLATAILQRFDGIWKDEATKNITLEEKSILTSQALEWAHEELSRKPSEDECSILQSNEEPVTSASDTQA